MVIKGHVLKLITYISLVYVRVLRSEDVASTVHLFKLDVYKLYTYLSVLISNHSEKNSDLYLTFKMLFLMKGPLQKIWKQ